MVKKLLESHTFHQGVRKAHKSWYRLRNGPLQGDEGGTNLERQGPGFGSHLWDEIQTQLGRNKKEDNPLQKSDPTHTTQSHKPTSTQPDQDRTTRSNTNPEPQPANESFLSHFMDELRSQSRGRDKRP
ncbi:hypothetical protein M436DRAFT_67127 [Aureobasidium namibiae CBS 147.97]|uniref:Uncharacterized protein n=1 Tax=Aureobasidium namibiae CBS 147.97 TaxID=1043004 RepID=A0A074X4C4_9PEZI|nr:uncharacterized protein M436DRAFT_67127 [Aureobasidium namibiae CBS 147.97]KEQ69461.1 hypothetical protein M436DRAFT_67127 [Aureobasidium namibiae CBS 147.97]